VKGWVADFLDVPAAQQFHFYVTTLVSNAITAESAAASTAWTATRCASRWRSFS
jgi:hypothetical protein